MALSGTKAQEATLGQYGSIFIDNTDAVTPPADKIICAITFMADTTVAASGGLLCENTASGSRIYMNTANAANNADTGSEGDNGKQIDAGNIFPKGLTIYGRWTQFKMAASDADGGVICYLAPKH